MTDPDPGTGRRPSGTATIGRYDETAPVLPPGWRLVHHPELDSTNQTVLAAASQGEPAGLIVLADRQQAGRGRLGRNWASPAGNFYGSWLLRPSLSPALWPTLSFVVGVALAECLIDAAPDAIADRMRLKWPNDLLLDGAKLAGILLEADGNGAVVVGCGVNLAAAPIGPGIVASALADCGVPLTPRQLLPLLLASFDRWYHRWQRDGFAPVRAAWLVRGHRPGDRLQLRDRGQRCFVDLDPDGSLVVTDPAQADPTPERIRAGDVMLAG